MLPGILSASFYGAGALVSVFSAFWLLGRHKTRQRHDPDSPYSDVHESAVFWLNAGTLKSCNFWGRRLLDSMDHGYSDESRLIQLLSRHFRDPERLVSPAEKVGDISLQSSDGTLQVLRDTAGDDVRLEISSRRKQQPDARDLHSLRADAEELRMLRANIHVAPFLLWRQNADGKVTWANKSYLDAVTQTYGPERASVWPLPSLLPDLQHQISRDSGKPHRLQTIATSANLPRAWYDCHMTELEGDTVCTAFLADEAVRSETRRREFTQTLTKTFASLSIGLAIFDRTRRLVLFNPALSDLTSIPPEIMASRPSLFAFLDKLRENRVMPEPRDYRSWRQSINELESAAANGTYTETWSLPDGRTFQVSGYPHPDGAVALLFEDISAEVSLTRRFRAQIEQSQSVLHALDVAVAIFSGTGNLIFANNAYCELWHETTAVSLDEKNVIEATRLWHNLTVPTPIWGDFREFAFQGKDRTEWSAQVTLRDGRAIHCRFVPQKAGDTLAMFRIQNEQPASVDELKHAV